MNRRDWLNSGLIIFGLLILAILVAQSRRNCEIPGSSWVPCIWGEPLKSNKGVVIYTLYRNSPTVGTISGDDARIHVATFDAAEDKDYNKNNCETARDLFASQPGVTVRYWCERGKFLDKNAGACPRRFGPKPMVLGVRRCGYRTRTSARFIN
jgi:hypothetical protein